MTKITRVDGSNTRDPGFAPLSDGGARAAASGAGLGSLAMRLGSEVVALGDTYMEKSMAAYRDAVSSKALADASLELDSFYEQRTKQTLDENGYPTFSTLSDDIAQGAAKIGEKHSAFIFDLEARQAFDRKFQNMQLSVELNARGEQRKQSLQFASSSLLENSEKLIQSGLSHPKDADTYLNQVDSMITQALDNGVITPQQAYAMRDGARSRIRTGVVAAAIEQDPVKALDMLDKQGAALTGLKQEEYEGLVRQAHAKIASNEVAARRTQQELDNLSKEQQKIVQSDLELGIAQGTVDTSHIIDAERRGQISHIQANKLQQKMLEHNTKVDTQQEAFSKISNAIVDGKPIVGTPAKYVDQHYNKSVASQTPQGQPASMSDKARVASGYTVPIPAFQKDLEQSIQYGNEQESVEALRAYEFVQERNSRTLDGMDKKAEAALSYAKVLTENTTISDARALQIAKDKVYNSDDITRKANLANFKKEDSFKTHNIQETIVNDVLDLSSTVVVDPQVSAIAEGLLRDAYAMTGNGPAAIEMAKNLLKDTVGVSEFGEKPGFFNDRERVMVMPPEKVFSGVPVEDLKEDLEMSINDYLPPGIGMDKVSIVSDERTRDPRLSPSWIVQYTDSDGMPQILLDSKTGKPIRWEPDAGTIDGSKDAIKKAREKQLEIENDPFPNPMIKLKREILGGSTDTIKKSVAPTVEKISNQPSVDNSDFVTLAKSFTGMRERSHYQALSSFFKESLGKKGNYDPRNTPWCALFVNSVLAASGKETSGQVTLARSFLEYGTPTSSPSKGDIAVFKRGSSEWKGHVGFYMGTKTIKGVEYIEVLGGNQDDQVSIKEYPATDLLGYRTPPSPQEIKAKPPTR